MTHQHLPLPPGMAASFDQSQAHLRDAILEMADKTITQGGQCAHPTCCGVDVTATVLHHMIAGRSVVLAGYLLTTLRLLGEARRDAKVSA